MPKSPNKVPVLDLSRYAALPDGVCRGGYVLEEAAEHEGAAPDIILVATGSEVPLAMTARKRLVGEGLRIRLVSLPCWELFAAQPETYRHEVIPPNVPLLAIEAGIPLGWQAYLGSEAAVIGIDHFGASAPGDVVMQEYGFTVENVCQRAREVMERKKEYR